MISKYLIPIRNSWVIHTSISGEVRTGLVAGSDKRNGVNIINVRWHGTNKYEWVPLDQLHSGFKLNMDVQDVPASYARASFGEGVVAKTRSFGGRDQVLVDFLSLGRRVWMPYERLRQIKGVKHRFVVGDKGVTDSAERFRLKSLAYAIELWNENTGSLSTLDIDPLPHQIHLVHHILASGNLNWLIADDVGLGKTIETGMLLAALKCRGQLKRVLLITPAGLTKQWKDELLYKFRLDGFQIYGEDFFINDPRHWKIYDYVIGSIDRLKDESHLEGLLACDSWDLIIFDEGHRLTRRQYGQRLESSQRFELAARLRSRTDSMIILSATPHQGMQDKFTALLELLRPERKEEISTLSLNPEILRDMVFRNHKADVTDVHGEFIFKGKTTKALRVETGAEARIFDNLLQTYFRHGYEAGKAKGIKGNAIGFVMTVYRKLASSSIAAIESALIKRKARLKGKINEINLIEDLVERDQRFSGEWEENLVTDRAQFFDGELTLLDALLVEAVRLRSNDQKLNFFLNDLINEILEGNSERKVLIFTEYTKTQDYLRHALQDRYGIDSVVVINGSMQHKERMVAIQKFEENSNFLISTEAGGEGINLQRRCHIMVNYDLPWNPMRLVQRIGRLYRYGQKKRVVVFNIHSPGTLDEKVIGLMYSRIDQVIEDLSYFGEEFNENLQDDILGDIADLLDVKQVLIDAIDEGISRTSERIDEAIKKARSATSIQRQLFQNAATYNRYETLNELTINQEHSKSFGRSSVSNGN